MQKWPNQIVLSILLFYIINVSTIITAQIKIDSESEEEFLKLDENESRSNLPKRLNVNPIVSMRANSNSCNCTSLFKCDLGLADSEEDGANVEVIDIRSQRIGSNPCSHYLDICCNQYQRQAVPDKPRTPLNPMRQCGKRNANGVGFRIVGNIEGEAQMGEFPWMSAITELNRAKGRAEYVCGATLITPRAVLTAAHCISKKFAENLSVRVGEWDTSTEREDPFVHQDREVDQIIIHEDYQVQKVLKNDIALLILSKDVPLARHIGTICLSGDKTVRKGQRCFASGWGKNSYGREGSYQSILKKVDLPLIPSNECESSFRETRLGSKFKLHESFICAGGERGKDTCKGDGGSPLVCQMTGSDRYYLQGIVSWGLNCGEPLPAAYVNVPHFVPWIEQKLRELRLDSSFFKVSGSS